MGTSKKERYMIGRIHTRTTGDFWIIEMTDGTKIALTGSTRASEKSKFQEKLQNVQLDNSLLDNSLPGRKERFEDLVRVIGFEQLSEQTVSMKLSDGTGEKISYTALKTLLW